MKQQEKQEKEQEYLKVKKKKNIVRKKIITNID